MLDIDSVLVDEQVIAECGNRAANVEFLPTIVIARCLRENLGDHEWVRDGLQPIAGKPYGYMDPGRWQAFARFMAANRLLKRADVSGAFTNSLLPSG